MRNRFMKAFLLTALALLLPSCGTVQTGTEPAKIRDTTADSPSETTFAGESRESDAEVGMFDFENKTVLLNSGYTMPILGLGTYALDHETCVNSVMALLENGGRLIDTAYIRENLDLFGFELTDGEMERIAALDRGEKHDWY